MRIFECERNLGGAGDARRSVGRRREHGLRGLLAGHHAASAASVVTVYNPEQEGQIEQSGAWYEYFVQNNDLPDEACVVRVRPRRAQRGTRASASPRSSTRRRQHQARRRGAPSYVNAVPSASSRRPRPARTGGSGSEGQGAEYRRVDSGQYYHDAGDEKDGVSGRMEHRAGAAGGIEEDDRTRRNEARGVHRKGRGVWPILFVIFWRAARTSTPGSVL